MATYNVRLSKKRLIVRYNVIGSIPTSPETKGKTAITEVTISVVRSFVLVVGIEPITLYLARAATRLRDKVTNFNNRQIRVIPSVRNNSSHT